MTALLNAANTTSEMAPVRLGEVWPNIEVFHETGPRPFTAPFLYLTLYGAIRPIGQQAVDEHGE